MTAKEGVSTGSHTEVRQVLPVGQVVAAGMSGQCPVRYFVIHIAVLEQEFISIFIHIGLGIARTCQPPQPDLLAEPALPRYGSRCLLLLWRSSLLRRARSPGICAHAQSGAAACRRNGQ